MADKPDFKPEVAWVADAAYPPRSGIGNYTYQLIRGLAGLGVRQTLIHWDKKPPLLDSPLPEIELPRWMSRRFIRRLAPPFHPSVRKRADLIHFPTEFDLYYVRPGRKLRVVTIHGCAAALMPAGLHHRMSPSLIKRLSKALLTVDGIVTVSFSSAGEINAVYGIPRERIEVIPNGVSGVFPGAVRADASWYRKKFGIDGPYVLSVGLMIPKKNQLTSLRVMRRLTEKRPELFFVQAGSHGPMKEKLKKEAVSMGLAGRFLTVGFQKEEDLARLYAGAEFLIFPSYHEGFGLPVAEAMAAGCPVIASKIPALEEITGELVPLFEPEDDQAMAEEALRLTEDEVYRRKVIETGRKHSGLYSWDNSAEKLLAFYQKLGRW